jgi:hypothetical protein
MELNDALAFAKTMVVEGIALASLSLAGTALIMIELWGLKKIWKLIRK